MQEAQEGQEDLGHEESTCRRLRDEAEDRETEGSVNEVDSLACKQARFNQRRGHRVLL